MGNAVNESREPRAVPRTSALAHLAPTRHPACCSHSYTQDFSRWSITGHSMGGHGALTIYLKNPGLFKSCSAFAPIS